MMDLSFVHYSEIDSTSTEIRRRIEAGENVEGLVITADSQTFGRGRSGKSFESADGKGLYFSMAVKACNSAETGNLACWAAVACANALKEQCGLDVSFKWVNDLIVNEKKLGGILLELVPSADFGNFIVIGIGINCGQRSAEFGSEIENLAISLVMLGIECRPKDLAEKLALSLNTVLSGFPGNKPYVLAEYRARCITVQKVIYLIDGDLKKKVFSKCINDNFALVCISEDGKETEVRSGEVSVRGINGYI